MKRILIDMPMMEPSTAQYLLKLAMAHNLTVLEVFVALANQRAMETISAQSDMPQIASKLPLPTHYLLPTINSDRSGDIPQPVVIQDEIPDLNLR